MEHSMEAKLISIFSVQTPFAAAYDGKARRTQHEIEPSSTLAIQPSLCLYTTTQVYWKNISREKLRRNTTTDCSVCKYNLRISYNNLSHLQLFRTTWTQSTCDLADTAAHQRDWCDTATAEIGQQVASQVSRRNWVISSLVYGRPM